jgi:hypothetical protein
MNSVKSRIACAICVSATLFAASTSVAQTCQNGIQAINPSSVYVVDEVNGLVTDTRTGLMWDRCLRGLSGSACATGSAVSVHWGDALAAPGVANSANFKGHSDWRLPNVRELSSLIEYCRESPTINELAFPGVPVGSFVWTNTPTAANTANAWLVEFDQGVVGNFNRSNTARVRLVRGGH